MINITTHTFNLSLQKSVVFPKVSQGVILEMDMKVITKIENYNYSFSQKKQVLKNTNYGYF